MSHIRRLAQIEHDARIAGAGQADAPGSKQTRGARPEGVHRESNPAGMRYRIALVIGAFGLGGYLLYC